MRPPPGGPIPGIPGMPGSPGRPGAPAELGRPGCGAPGCGAPAPPKPRRNSSSVAAPSLSASVRASIARKPSRRSSGNSSTVSLPSPLRSARRKISSGLNCPPAPGRPPGPPAPPGGISPRPPFVEFGGEFRFGQFAVFVLVLSFHQALEEPALFVRNLVFSELAVGVGVEFLEDRGRFAAAGACVLCKAESRKSSPGGHGGQRSGCQEFA